MSSEDLTDLLCPETPLATRQHLINHLCLRLAKHVNQPGMLCSLDLSRFMTTNILQAREVTAPTLTLLSFCDPDQVISTAQSLITRLLNNQVSSARIPGLLQLVSLLREH